MSGTLRAPGLQLVISGKPIPALTAEVSSNGFYHADSFKAELYTGNAAVMAAGFGAAFWADAGTGSTPAPVMIAVQVDPGTSARPGWTTLISGRVDDLDYDPMTGVVNITGRDRTADLIEARTFQSYKNQTSSEVATKLAQEHGLTPNIAVTTTLIERYYSADHDKLTLSDFHHAVNEWDLLTFLAQQEGFDVWVSDTTLNFQPPPPITQNPLVFDISPLGASYAVANGIDIKLSRSLGLARDIEVTVKSWSSQQAKAFTVTAKSSNTKASSAAATAKAGSSATQNYNFTRPNLTKQQALDFAQKKAHEISLHERKVTVSGQPLDVTTTPRQGLQITGTGTGYDMTYYVTEVTRSMSAEAFTQTVTAKNQSPRDVTTVG